MNRLVRLLLLGVPLLSVAAHAAEQRIQDFLLDDHMVYTIPVSGTRVC